MQHRLVGIMAVRIPFLVVLASWSVSHCDNAIAGQVAQVSHFAPESRDQLRWRGTDHLSHGVLEHVVNATRLVRPLALSGPGETAESASIYVAHFARTCRGVMIRPYTRLLLFSCIAPLARAADLVQIGTPVRPATGVSDRH